LMSRDGNDRRMNWHGRKSASHEELAQIADKIRAHVKDE
jgi:hypothetical protein